ncbi:MAG: hypothetical protein ACRCWQ_00975 [Bacilli bacterium]
MQTFIFDERLGISRPELYKSWKDYSHAEQQRIVTRWEMERGRIPDRIFALERNINQLQSQLDVEPQLEIAARINAEIAELASIINDLWLWFRMDEKVEKEHL